MSTLDRLRGALLECRVIVTDNMRCNHPELAEKAQEDFCDGEDCIMCGIVLTVDAALAESK